MVGVDRPVVDEFADAAALDDGVVVALDQLCLSGQCGFSSTVEGNVLTQDDQWRKLALIVEVAEEVWG